MRDPERNPARDPRPLPVTAPVSVPSLVPPRGPRLARAWLAPIAALALAGCVSWIPNVHVPPVQQGNVVEQESLAKLKPGMTRSQVRFVLGTPLIVDVFRQDRWDYVFMLKRPGEPVQQRRVTVVFDGDALARIEGDVVGTAPAKAAGPAAVPPSAAKADGSVAPSAAKADGSVAPSAAKADGSVPPASKPAAAAPPAERGFFGRLFGRIGL
jgi:outer membrane protein assembly factor BamE